MTTTDRALLILAVQRLERMLAKRIGPNAGDRMTARMIRQHLEATSPEKKQT